ncbi:MAG: hypothetical protein FWD73_15135 [Polyangiaceae bacterium]|nr:hypothetical protein [Polyangiaceae bacterium]
MCIAPTPDDGIQNGDETDVDCGGSIAPRCDEGQGCLEDADCSSGICDETQETCSPSSHTNGIKDDGETGVDCGGTAPKKCPTGEGCITSSDCDNLLCTAEMVCDSPRNNDHLKNGNETDVDCGSSGNGTPTNAPQCAIGKTCGGDSDCTSSACNYNHKCVESISCKGHHGGDTCGPNGNESCCISLPTGGNNSANLDKYNITAGRFRQFVESLTGGDMRTWLTAHKPADWPSSWTAMLPTTLDNGGANPDYTGIYQELGPYVHAPEGDANRGCNINGNGARTYRLPDAVNTRIGDPQYYTQDFLDDRSLNCVTAPMLAAFCVWDGGKLATKAQLDTAWGTKTYPWGTAAPAGYSRANGEDPMGQWGVEAFGDMQGEPYVNAPFPLTAFYANYNYNYWGGADVIATDYSIYISPPGRFPTGNSLTGHADLAGNVFNAMSPPNQDGTVNWFKNGSWQGHAIGEAFGYEPSSNKYWAMGGRCTH